MLASERHPLDPFYIEPIRAGTRVMPDMPGTGSGYGPHYGGIPPGGYRRQRIAETLANPGIHPELLASYIAENQMTGSAPTIKGYERPVFRNDMERGLAIDAGEYDPEFATPMHRAAYIAATKNDVATQIAKSELEQKQFPYQYGGTNAEKVRAQLAGDPGYLKGILQSLQKVSPTQVGRRDLINAYSPEGGYGGMPSEEALESKLDFNVINDPEWIKQNAIDPKRGEFAYQKMTGRSYKTDLETHNAIIKSRNTHGTSMVRREIAGGTIMDPETREWMGWDKVEPDESMGLGVAKPAQRWGKLSKERADIMNRYYTSAFGREARPSVDKPAVTQGKANIKKIISSLSPSEQAGVDEVLQRMQAETGLKPTHEDLVKVATKIIREQPEKPWTPYYLGSSYMDKGIKAAAGLVNFMLPTEQNIFNRAYRGIKDPDTWAAMYEGGRQMFAPNPASP